MTYQDILDLINANLASGSKIQAVKHREVETALLDFIQSNSAQKYDIKAIYANSTYLGENFESDGLGKNLRTGWAICNGNNGTPPMQGRTIVNYGGDFTTLNAVGGSKDAVVVSHSHKTIASTGTVNFHSTSNNFNDGGQTWSASGTIDEKYSGIAFEGESGVNKNMQPYIVLVYIMKL